VTEVAHWVLFNMNDALQTECPLVERRELLGSLILTVRSPVSGATLLRFKMLVNQPRPDTGNAASAITACRCRHMALATLPLPPAPDARGVRASEKVIGLAAGQSRWQPRIRHALALRGFKWCKL
jgi:hypothetical protein